MSLHFPLPKTRTFRFSLHTSHLSLRGEITLVALKFAMSSHLPLPKIFRPQSLFPLFQMAMNLHFPLPKTRTVGDELTLSLAKNSHFSFLPSHFPSLPSRRGHHGGAEIRNEYTLGIAKNFFALSLCSPSGKWHEPRDEWSKTQDKRSNLAQSYFVLPIEKLNQINTKSYWK